MPDWLFHWTHDEVFKEVLKVSIPALGSILAALIAWYGIRRTAKVTQEALENSKEATPPELLRLEKWSTILQESKDYPQEIKEGLDLAAIYSTYNDVLVRATLENEIMKLGVLSPDIRQELLQIKPGSGGKYYPSPSRRVSGRRDLLVLIGGIAFSAFILIISIYNISKHDLMSRIVYILCMVFSILSIIIFLVGIYNHVGRKTVSDYIRDITFRNSYRALKSIYLAPGVDNVFENEDQMNQRKEFEKRRGYNVSYLAWRRGIEDKYPEWTSWNYGLNIDWNNDPNANSIEY